MWWRSRNDIAHRWAELGIFDTNQCHSPSIYEREGGPSAREGQIDAAVNCSGKFHERSHDRNTSRVSLQLFAQLLVEPAFAVALAYPGLAPVVMPAHHSATMWCYYDGAHTC
jgi:hypothetical protein